MKAEEVRVDAVVLTHGHGDHFGDTLEIARNNSCPVYASYEICNYLGEEGITGLPVGIGGSHKTAWGRVKQTLAFHGTGLELPDGRVLNAGNPAGVLLTIGDKTLYHAGDTALFSDMKLIGELNKIDAATLPIGDVFTMGPEDALIAATWLKAGLYIPMHYNTFPPIAQDGDQWVQDLAAHGLQGFALQPGESVEV
jgi:L-ascorbate metabolism protein UlaG (beta-lactamase superfamily)